MHREFSVGHGQQNFLYVFELSNEKIDAYIIEHSENHIHKYVGTQKRNIVQERRFSYEQKRT